MTKHTPGPWHVVEKAEHKGKGILHIVEEGGNSYWEIATLMTHDAELEANARLIAAAPELLEALEEIVTELHGAIYNRALSTWATKEVAYKHADGLVEKYRALIAKAKGEA
jgi:hypothetical protein